MGKKRTRIPLATNSFEGPGKFFENHRPSGSSLFPAYRPPEAPAIPGFNSDGFHSSATYESFARTMEQKRREEAKRKEAERRRRKEEAEQDKTPYAVKMIGLYSSEDDDDCMIVSSSIGDMEERKSRSPSVERIDYGGSSTSSRRDQSQSSRKSRDDRKKKKKRRRRSSSSDSSNDSDHIRRKKRRRYSSSEPEFLSDRPSQGPAKKEETWSLVDEEFFTRKSTNIAMLLVSDVKGDKQNLEFDSLYHLFVPQYRLLVRAIFGASDRLNYKLYNYKGVPEKSHVIRYYDQSIHRLWGKKPAERQFRKKTEINADFLPLSHAPYNSDDDEGPVKKEWTVPVYNLTLDDFELIKNSKIASIEEADCEKKNQILNGYLKEHKNDIDKWLEFIALQDELVSSYDFATTEQSVKARSACERKLEIIGQALKENPRSVELKLERVKIMEQLQGSSEQEIEQEWKKLENQHLNNIKMWKANIIMHQNDRALFKLDKMISLVDRCIDKISNLVNGNIRSHSKEPESEEFLVDLIVLRCRLHMETGFFSKVVSVLQALVEFHIFTPKGVPLEKCKKLFEDFWNSGSPRVGDEEAKGWNETKPIKLLSAEYDEEKIKEYADEYHGFLGPQLKELELQKQPACLEECRAKGLSHPQVWAMLELLRDEFTWRPLRFEQKYMMQIFSWCKDNYVRDIEPILVKFPDQKFVIDLICKLLKLLGCEVPGYSDMSQESILSTFGVLSKFPKNRDRLVDFFDRFLRLLSNAETLTPEVRAKFFVTRLLMLQKNAMSGKDLKSIKRQLKTIVSNNMDASLGPLVSYFGAKAFETFDAEVALNTYKKILSVCRDDYWQMKDRIHRLAYLRLAVSFCQLLPYHHQQRRVDKELTKKHFLRILGEFGRFVEAKNEVDVKSRWIDRVNKLKDVQPDPTLDWLGDEFLLTLELASIFFYETVAPSIKIIEFDGFLKGIQAVVSNKAKESIWELRLRVIFDHVTYFKNEGFRYYRELVNQAINEFPTNASFLKRYIDCNKYQSARIFLRQQCKDKLIQLVRHCGLYYLENRAHDVLAMESSPNNVDHIRHTLEFIAPENCGQSFFPDCTLWRILLNFEKKHGNSKKQNEVFLLAFKQCPWSKNLLLDIAVTKLNIDGFLTDIANYASSSGFLTKTLTEEVEILLTPDVLML